MVICFLYNDIWHFIQIMYTNCESFIYTAWIKHTKWRWLREITPVTILSPMDVIEDEKCMHVMQVI